MEIKQDTLNKSSSSKNTTNPNKKKKSKWVVYLILILIVLAIVVGLYFRFDNLLSFKHYNIKDVMPQDDNSKVSSNDINNDANNLSQFNNYLKNLQQWQKDINNKIDVLSQQKLNNQENDNAITNQKIDQLKQQINNLSNQKNIITNVQVTLRFINKINSNSPYNDELVAFEHTSFAKNYTQYFDVLDSFAEIGVLTNTDLANQFATLEQSIRLQVYAKNTSKIGKIKYYLAKFVTINKVRNFNNKDINTTNYKLFKIKDCLQQNQLQTALNLLNDPDFQEVKGLDDFKKQLQARYVLNQINISLNQYLLNYTPVE
ncbi:hypothetical protein ACFX5K_04315 [Rickettsiales bacterium LUAb2]